MSGEPPKENATYSGFMPEEYLGLWKFFELLISTRM
jgi:hypothetical protein